MDRIAYPLKDAADAVGISLRKLQYLVAQGELIPRYIGSKPVLPASELQAWFDRLPTDPPGR